MTGLPAVSVKESTERVRSAIINSGLDWRAGRHTTVNLAPAELRKEGSGLDLPIAVGIVLAGLRLEASPTAAFLAELSLDGRLRHVNGVLVAARALKDLGFDELFVAESDAAEAALAQGLTVRASSTRHCSWHRSEASWASSSRAAHWTSRGPSGARTTASRRRD